MSPSHNPRPSLRSSEDVALAKRFERDGFVVLERFFPGPVMELLDGLIDRHAGEVPGLTHTDEFVGEAQVEVTPWFPHLESVDAFAAVEHSPELDAVTDVVLGAGWRADYCMVMFSESHSAGQAWHQDCPPEHPSQFNLNRLAYTRAIDPANGGQLALVPGSHLLGELPVGAPHGSLTGEIVIAPGRGDLVLVHGHCWHRVLPIGAQARTSVNFRAVPAGVRDAVTDVCVYRTMRYRFSTSEVLVRR